MNIVLDFDRTLFDTSEFSLWFAQEIANLSGEGATEVRKEATTKYYVHIGDLYYYDMQAHLTSIFKAKADEALEFISNKGKQKNSFMFDDVRRTLSKLENYGELSILTFGNEDYQRFKISLCPELAHIPVRIVQSSKGPHLQEQFSSKKRCIFVDDKDEHGLLPEWVEFYHLQRAESPTVYEKHDYKVIESFDDLLKMISAKQKKGK